MKIPSAQFISKESYSKAREVKASMIAAKRQKFLALKSINVSFGQFVYHV